MSLEIVNLVATGDLKQSVDLFEISKLPYSIFDSKIYGGRVAYIKTPQMHGKVTIFPSGKLISVGTKSYESAQKDIDTVLTILSKKKLIKLTPIELILRNIVAVFTFQHVLNLEEVAYVKGAMYEPEQFLGVILKLEVTNATYLIFNSGKIVISGTNSMEELNKSVEIIKDVLSQYKD